MGQRRGLIVRDVQTIHVTFPGKKKPTHNTKETATAKSHLVPLNKASADDPFDVPGIVELTEMMLLRRAWSQPVKLVQLHRASECPAT